MTKVLVLVSAFFLVLASPVWAIEEGLSSVVVIPAGESDTGAGIVFLESLPGFQEAVWDTARDAWVASVEDSVQFEPRELVAGLAEVDIEVETLRLEFGSAYAKVLSDEVRSKQGYLLSPSNDMKFVVIFGTNSKRLWYFLGKSVLGQIR